MSFPMAYERAIGAIVAHCPQPDKFAHMFAGLCLWLVAALVLRQRLASRWPISVVLLAEVANECVDYWANHSWRWPDTLGDAAATWFWPLTLSLAITACPWLGAERKISRSRRS